MINILHLYYDLLNLYGESGNLKALIYSLKDQNVKVNVDYLSINDEVDFSKYDLIYIGCGTKNNLLIALEDIKKYKNDLKDLIDNNKFIISTGNSINLFGESIDNIDALNLFNYKTSFLDKRVVGDRIIDSKLTKDKIIGFLNNDSKILNNNSPLFNEELGFIYNNFYGTYLLGPLLVRNPELNKYIVTKLLKEKNNKFKFNKFDLSLDKKAYDSYLETYYK